MTILGYLYERQEFSMNFAQLTGIANHSLHLLASITAHTSPPLLNTIIYTHMFCTLPSLILVNKFTFHCNQLTTLICTAKAFEAQPTKKLNKGGVLRKRKMSFLAR
jgi:hypothetical protein